MPKKRQTRVRTPSRAPSRESLERKAELDREIEAGLRERMARYKAEIDRHLEPMTGGAAVMNAPERRRGDYGAQGYSIGRAQDSDEQPEQSEQRGTMGGSAQTTTNMNDVVAVLSQLVSTMKTTTTANAQRADAVADAMQSLQGRLESSGVAMMLVGRCAARAGMSFPAWMQHCMDNNIAPWTADRQLPNRSKGEWTDDKRRKQSEHMKEVWRKRKALLAKAKGDGS